MKTTYTYKQIKELKDKVKKHAEHLNMSSDYKTYSYADSAIILKNNKQLSNSEFKALMSFDDNLN